MVVDVDEIDGSVPVASISIVLIYEGNSRPVRLSVFTLEITHQCDLRLLFDRQHGQTLVEIIQIIEN